jgi:SAM-dependent methyltransferase
VTDPADFAADLYQGTALDYERYRLGYPTQVLEDLLDRCWPSGQGLLVDLACGTGQLAFALSPRFAEVWAVDQEPDMVRVVADKASGKASGSVAGKAAGAGRVRPVVSRAEDLEVPDGSVELVTIGNAFHRLRRDAVEAWVHGWLRPGGRLALCWSTSPWVGDTPWQRALADVIARWRTRLDAADRTPPGWDRDRRDRPDAVVLGDAGFEVVAHVESGAEHSWTIPELVGHLYSTSFLPRAVVGAHAAAFERDLLAELSPHAEHGPIIVHSPRAELGTLTETVSFAYHLARRPA